MTQYFSRIIPNKEMFINNDNPSKKRHLGLKYYKFLHMFQNNQECFKIT